jgi:leucine dehydrogenase
MLKERNILYAPDYVINAGGLINVYQELRGYNKDEALKKASGIYHTLINVFEVANQEGITSILASNRIAEKRLDEARRTRSLSNTYNNQRWIAR